MCNHNLNNSISCPAMLGWVRLVTRLIDTFQNINMGCKWAGVRPFCNSDQIDPLVPAIEVDSDSSCPTSQNGIA